MPLFHLVRVGIEAEGALAGTGVVLRLGHALGERADVADKREVSLGIERLDSGQAVVIAAARVHAEGEWIRGVGLQRQAGDRQAVGVGHRVIQAAAGEHIVVINRAASHRHQQVVGIHAAGEKQADQSPVVFGLRQRLRGGGVRHAQVE
jgi:hypothetical protein